MFRTPGAGVGVEEVGVESSRLVELLEVLPYPLNLRERRGFVDIRTHSHTHTHNTLSLSLSHTHSHLVEVFPVPS